MRLPIAGVYRDPFENGRLRDDADTYWSQAMLSIPRVRQSLDVLPLLLLDRDDFVQAAADAQESVAITWEAPLAGALTVETAQELAAGLEAIGRDTTVNDHPLAEAVEMFTGSRVGLLVESALPEIVEEAAQLTAALVPPLQALLLAAQVTALAVVSAAAVLLHRRRASEARVATALGTSPWRLGVRAPLEMLPAVVAGAVVGWLAALPLVRVLGPSPLLGAARVAQAGEFAVLAAVAALFAVAVSTAVAAARSQRLRDPAPSTVSVVWWELVVLALAAAAGYQTLIRGSARSDGGVDLLIVAFPLLGVVAAVGLAVRGLGRVAPRLARRAHGVPRDGSGLATSAWLAGRRLARQPRQGLVLVTVGGVALGLLVYAATLTSSTGPAVDAKVAALAGAEASAGIESSLALQEEGGLPTDLPTGTAVVWRGPGTVWPEGLTVRLLVVDPATVPQAALWRDSFAQRDLETLLGRIAPPPGDPPWDQPLPVLAVAQGDEAVPQTALLGGGGFDPLPMQVVGRPSAFPGMTELRPTLILDARSFFPLVGRDDPTLPPPRGFEQSSYEAEVWAAGGLARLEAYLQAEGVPMEGVTTRAQVAARPELLVQTWSLGYLLALGAGIGVLALAALLAYAEQRRAAREVADALTRRMGLSRIVNAGAAGLELVGLLTAALVLGLVTGLAAASLVVARLDPLPTVPPAPVIVPPLPVLLTVAGLVVVSAVLGAVALQWRADRADVAEVLRVAE